MVKEKIEPQGFFFVKKTENPDISFRRVGVNAGKIDVNSQEKSIQSHYFLKFKNNKSLQDNINVLSKISFSLYTCMSRFPIRLCGTPTPKIVLPKITPSGFMTSFK